MKAKEIKEAEIVFDAAIERLQARSESIAIEISERFMRRVKQNPNIKISDKSRAIISRRVSDVDRFATPEGVPVLLSLDISSLCDRLVCYPYIPRYRRRLLDEDIRGRSALITHIHSLTGNEMYTVLERSNVLLHDVLAFAQDNDIAGASGAAGFQKAFRARFEYSLRERHRTSHAHEVPSLRSRAVNIANRARGLPSDSVKALYEKPQSDLNDQWAFLGEMKAQEFRENVTQKASIKGQEQRFIDDAEDALTLIADHMRRTLVPEI